MSKETPKESFDLFKAFKMMVAAEHYLASVANNKQVKGTAKNFINTLRNRISVNIADLRILLPMEDRKILDDDMLDPEVVFQIENVTDIIADLPKGIRDEIEAYAESRHNIYKLNK